MSSKKWVDSPRLQTHLEWLLKEVEPRAEAMRSLDIAELVVDFFCFSLGASASPPSFPRSIIERADLLGIRVEMDHYDTRQR